MTMQNDCHDPPVIDRLEVVAGPTGRRRWSAEAKARIVAESFAPDVSVSAVARRHGLRPAQLFAWRRLARDGRLALAFEEGPGFAPVVITPERDRAGPRCDGDERIEIDSGAVIVRLPGATPAARIAEIAQALRGVS